MTDTPLSAFEAQLLTQARALVAGDPPPPWRRGVVVAAAGVAAGGWTSDERIVIVSADGYSVTDADSGDRLIRDRDARIAYAALSPDGLTFRLPRSGEIVAVFGIYGGDGRHLTDDGWGVELISPWWPRTAVILRTPAVAGAGQHGYLDRAHLLDLGHLDPGWLRCGFSPSGRHLMILGEAGAELHSR